MREHTQAQELCRYLKFLSEKATVFSTSAILQFDDEFRGMVARSEANYDHHTSLNDLQAHHFDFSTMKKRSKSRSLSANTATSRMTTLITAQGANTHTRVSCVIPRSTALCFMTF